MWKRLRRKHNVEDRWAGIRAAALPSKPEILRSLPNDKARYDQCLAWAEAESIKFYQGLRETQEDVMGDRTGRYDDYSTEACRKIANQMWAGSATAKAIAGNEQMYGRWAGMYVGSTRGEEHAQS